MTVLNSVFSAMSIKIVKVFLPGLEYPIPIVEIKEVKPSKKEQNKKTKSDE